MEKVLQQLVTKGSNYFINYTFILQGRNRREDWCWKVIFNWSIIQISHQ